MRKGLNFRTIDSQKEYFETYGESLKLISSQIVEKYIATSFGDSHVICSGDESNPPLVLALMVILQPKMIHWNDY